MSRLLNPGNPTFKRQPGDPPLPKSMAYFLYSPLADAPVSYDDCKKTDAPSALIPGIRKGDMVEYKNENFFVVRLRSGHPRLDEFEWQLKRQSNAVENEGLNRKVFYCMGSTEFYDIAQQRFGGLYKHIYFADCSFKKSCL